MIRKSLSRKIYAYTVLFEPADEGGFVVRVPALPGCVTEGDTFEEAQAMAEDAIRTYLASLKKHREPIPTETASSLVGRVTISV